MDIYGLFNSLQTRARGGREEGGRGAWPCSSSNCRETPYASRRRRVPLDPFVLAPSLSSLILCLLLLFLRGGKLLIPAVLISGDLRCTRKGLLLDPFSLWLHLANNSSGRRRKKESNYFVGSFFSYLEDTRCACDKGRESFFKWPDEPCLSSSSLRPRCNVRKRTEFFELRVTLAHTTKVFLSLFTFLEYLTNAFQSLHTFLRNSGEYPYSSPDSFCRPPLPMQAVLASPQERKRMKANCCKWEKRRRKPDGLPPSLPPPSVPPRLCLMFKERRECMVRCCSPYFSPPPLWPWVFFPPSLLRTSAISTCVPVPLLSPAA